MAGFRQRILLALLFTAGVPAFCGEWLEQQTVSVGELTRYYRVFLPTDLQPDAPAVVVLHGGNGDYVAITRDGAHAEWPEIAEEEGVVLLVPNGINGQTGDPNGVDQRWNDCRADNQRALPIDDVGFIEALIDIAIDRWQIDPERVYATGGSNGGMMSFRLAFELGHRIAAIAPFIANLPANDGCLTPVDPTPVFLCNGDAEVEYMPWDGGCVASGGLCEAGEVISAEATRDWWLRFNRVTDTHPVETDFERTDADDATVTTFAYEGGIQGAEVTFCRVYGGGHTIPSIDHVYDPDALDLFGLGNQSVDMEGAREAWQFLKRQELNGAPRDSPAPGGSAYLDVDKATTPGRLKLRWSSDCGSAQQFAVYRGDLSAGYDSLRPSIGLCNVSSTSAEVVLNATAAEFFLVVPNDGSFEGSYGFDSDGQPRAAASTRCHVPASQVDRCDQPLPSS